MSRIALVCHREGTPEDARADRVGDALARLSPDNIEFPAPVVARPGGVAIAVSPPTEAVDVRDGAVCAGAPTAPLDRWWVPSGPVPDGSFAIFRSDPGAVELLCDAAASRTIWYYLDDSLLIASTSQRAIVSLLGRFEPDPSAKGWMVSAGMLGPGHSWDARIRRLGPDARLRLDRRSWESTVSCPDPVFDPRDLTRSEHREALSAALGDTFDRLDLDPSGWVLPLSGGYDSRAILSGLGRREGLRCVTWGLAASLDDPESDASVARLLAERAGADHRYFVTDLTADEDAERVLARFLEVGEGRVDHLSGYTDGFRIWKLLFEEGVRGIIRGDEGFGWEPVRSALDVRLSVGLVTLGDYSGSPGRAAAEFPGHAVPARLGRRRGESLAAWRDRLYHTFRIPVILAALTDLKSPYVEVVNPLLSRRILEVVRSEPDDLRTGKALFREIVREASPDVPFATRSAVGPQPAVLRTPGVVEVLREELRSTAAAGLLPDEVVRFALDGMEVDERGGSRGGGAGRRAAARLRGVARRVTGKLRADPNLIAFRAFLVSRADRMFREDAAALD